MFKILFCFRIAKAKETNKYFYPMILPLKKKKIVLFIYFCIENAKIVLCESILIYMSSVTHMGHIDWYDKYNFVL